MRVTQARLSQYRASVSALGDAASTYVEQYMLALMAEYPDLSVEELREEAIGAINDSLYAFGDQAQAVAIELFDEIAEAGGFDADAAVYDVIDPRMVNEKVRYFARLLIDEKYDAFTRDVADVTRYYIKRSAYENMVRNCERNDVRYARVPSGRETCAFCFMLSSRGFVYRSEETAGGEHGYHDHCDCVIAPGFKDMDPGEQIEGYDPEGMRERWRECQGTIGGEKALRKRWDAMPKAERARYKGRSDDERWRRFLNAETRREAETRDWRWLYSGDVPRYEVEPRAKPNKGEIDTARRLADNGYKSRFRATRSSEGKRTSDAFFLCGDRLNPKLVQWEFKGPTGNGKQTIHHQFEEAAGQSHSVVIDCADLGEYWTESRTVEEVDRKLKRGFTVRRGVNRGDNWHFDEAIIVFKDGSISKKKERLDPPCEVSGETSHKRV